MATIAGNLNEQELDQEKQNQPGQQNQGEVISGVGGSPVPPTGAAPAQNSTQNFNQAQQAPRQIGSGRFTNLQQYLGANKQAGQQLGQNLQQGINQKITQAQGTADRTLGEANQRQDQAKSAYQTGWQQYSSLGGAANQYTPPAQQYKDVSGNPIAQAPISQSQQYSFATPTDDSAAKGTLASEYVANIGSRQNAAMDIANNADALSAFSGLRTGETQSGENAAIQAKNQIARDTAESLRANQAQRMQQLTTESGRGGLLNEFIGNKNYGVGQRSLDSAFLQRDPNRSLDALKQNIGARASDVKQSLANVGTIEDNAKTLSTQGTDLSTGLGAQTAQNTKDYVDNIQSRISTMEGQRGQKMDWAQKQLENFKKGVPLNKEFIDLMGLKKGTQLFNTVRDLKGAGEILNVDNLNRSLSFEDATNDQDITNYAALAKLQGLSPGEMRVTKSTADKKDIEQYTDGRDMQGRAKTARDEFIKNSSKNIVTGDGGWVGGNKYYTSQNALDFLVGRDSSAREHVRRDGDFTGRQYSPLTNYGTDLYNSLSNSGMIPGVNAVDGNINTSGQVNLDKYINPIGYRNEQAYGEEGDRADANKNAGYARNRSAIALQNELANYLKDSGFHNYYSQDDTIATGNISGGGQPSQDLDQFGYGNMDLSGAGFYKPPANNGGLPAGTAPKLGSALGNEPPMISLDPMETQAVSPGMSRDEALQQLAASGQLPVVR